MANSEIPDDLNMHERPLAEALVNPDDGVIVDSPEKRGVYKYTTRMVARVACASVFVGAVLVAGASRAKAASPTMLAAEATSRGWDIDWGSLIAGTGLALTALAIVRQTSEKTRDRFYAALQGIKGESTGEERLARLNAIEPFAERRRYAQEVLRASVAYLRGRRGGLVKLQHTYRDKPDELDGAITERRNADRSAFSLFLEALPAVRHQMHRRELARRIAWPIKIVSRGGDRELQRLDKITGLRVGTEKVRVNARGICLDDMRGEVQNCDLGRVDLTGAGLQRNDIVRVSFRQARLCEAQLEGSRLSRCGLQGADLRAVYFGDTDYAVFEKCVIDAHTKFGNLPDNHPNAKVGKLDPDRAAEYRGMPNVVLKDLRSDTLSDAQIIQVVHEWQRRGLVLKPGSDPEYFLVPQ